MLEICLGLNVLSRPVPNHEKRENRLHIYIDTLYSQPHLLTWFAFNISMNK